MAFASVIAAEIVSAVFVRRRKIAARSRAVCVDRAVSIFADTALKSDTFDLMFYFGPLHAAMGGI